MEKSLVLTVIGLDRPGIVERVAKTVSEHGGNWVESRMTKLAGRFAGVVRVDVDANDLQSLKAALSKLESDGLAIGLEPVASDAGLEDGTPDLGKGFVLSFVGHDREGLVREVTQALAIAGVNVLELMTRVYSAPMSGELLFEAIAHLSVPADVDVPKLNDELHVIAERLDLDLSFAQGETTDCG